MSIDRTLVDEGIQLKRERELNQWKWGAWALKVEPIGKQSVNTGSYGRLQVHLDQIWQETSDETPALKTVVEWRYIVSTWSDLPTIPMVAWSVLAVLAADPDRYELLANPPQGGWTKQAAINIRKARVTKQETHDALDRLREEQQNYIQSLEKQLKDLRKKLGAAKNVSDEDLLKDADREARARIDQTFLEMMASFDNEEEGASAVESLIAKVPDVRAIYRNRTTTAVAEVATAALKASLKLKEQGLEPLDGNRAREFEHHLEAVERFIISAREALNEVKARLA